MSEFNVRPLQDKLERYKHLSSEIERFERFLGGRIAEDVLFSLVKHIPDRDMCYPREKEERICPGRTIPAFYISRFYSYPCRIFKERISIDY